MGETDWVVVKPGLHIRNVQEASFPIWTKTGYWPGEYTFEFPDEAAKDRTMMEKVNIDLSWEITGDDYQSMPGRIPMPDSFTAAWMAESEKVKVRQAQVKQSFPKLVQERRGQLLAALKDTILPMLALCQSAPGTPDEHVAAVLGPVYEGRDLHVLVRWRLNFGAVNIETKLCNAPFDTDLRNVYNPARK